MPATTTLRRQLRCIYGAQGPSAFDRVMAILERFKVKKGSAGDRFSEKEVVLVTYADSLRRAGERPLQTLFEFATARLTPTISTIHLLPFFPYSSDDGFSVIDYFSVNPSVGVWDDMVQFRRHFDLMFDFVLNHISAQSPWFKHYLDALDGYRDLAIEVAPETDLSAVTRPRTHPLLTSFSKSSGQQVHLWTTFSADQIDLNYKSVDVLCHMVEVLLYYIEKGARFIRMDAVAYVWKEVGTDCIHRPQAHALVKVFRSVLDMVAPHVVIITETNVPHAENLSYFGNGYDEAQMVYNFSLPPLLLHTFITTNTEVLSQWAEQLNTPSNETTFLNFTASHDGIGIRPLEGILSDRQIDELIVHARKCGGDVSSKRNADGGSSAYELNVTYVDAMGKQEHRGTRLHAKRFLASQAISLSLPGVPAVYLHSLLGSRNWREGVDQTGRRRTINRQPLDMQLIEGELDDAGSFRSLVFENYTSLLRIRRRQPAFHPNADFQVLSLNPGIFAIRRSCKAQTIYALTSVSEGSLRVSLEAHGVDKSLKDLLSGHRHLSKAIDLAPYQTAWLTEGNG